MIGHERMSPVDRAWLLMDRPTNPMMIVAVIMLQGKLPHARLCELITQRFAAYPRFHCRPASETLSAQWIEVEDFDLEDHVIRVALPAPGDQNQLEALVGELAGSPFNAVRPWWTFHLVEHYGEGSALVARIHHCYADGIALIQVLLSMADDAPVNEVPQPGPRKSRRKRNSSMFGSFYEPLVGAVASTLKQGAKLVAQGVSYTLEEPRKALDAATDAAADAAGMLSNLASIGTRPDDPPTCLKRELSGARRVAWAAPLAFDEVRAVAKSLGCTINDVLIATLAGALGKYLESRGETMERALHAAVPVNLRDPKEPPGSLGNRFGLVFVDLPVAITHPLERVYSVHDSMKALKGSSEALVTYGLLAAVGTLPAALEERAIDLFTAKASLVASNVPGPRTEISIGGVPVAQMLFWVPQAGSIGTGISMLSYHGQVHFGVISDRQLIPEPSALAAHFGTEFERLALLVLMSNDNKRPG